MKPDLPAAPSALETECPDPGVAANAIVAVAENRTYAACNKRKHRDFSAFYRNVRKRFGGDVS